MKQNLLFKGTKRNVLPLLWIAVMWVCSTSLRAEWPSYPGSAGISGSYVLNEPSEWKKSTIWEKEFDLNGPGNTLTFSAKCVAISWIFWGGDLHVQQYVDGSWSSDLMSQTPPKDNYQSYSVQLDKRATKIKFEAKTGATGEKYIKDIKVTLATYAGAPAASSLNFGSADIGTADQSLTTTFDWSNTAAYAVSITGDEADFFTASVSNNAAAGKYGTATVTVAYKHTEAGTHSAVLHLGGYTVALSGTTTKLAQTIEWETPDAVLTTDTLTLNATAQGQVLYTNETPEIATLVDNTVTFLTAGKLKLTATAIATPTYNAATLTKTITVVRATPAVSEWPSLGEITYGETLASVMLAGGLADVEGAFSIAEDDLSRIPEGGEQQISVQFLPANTDWYNTLTNTLSLLVNPAEQEIVWEPADSILTTTALTLDATAKTPVSYTNETPDIATLNEDNTVTILQAGVLRLTATAAATANYNAATLTKTITVVRATPEITSLPTLAQLTYGQKLSEAVLSGGEADAEGEFVLNVEDSEAVLNVGEYDLKVQFVPANADWYTTVDTVVVLSVAKAEQTIVWELPESTLVTGELLLAATAEGTVTYEIETTDIAAFNAEGTALTFAKAGELRLTVLAAETEHYKADTLTKTITVVRVTPEILAAPALAPVVQGKTLADVTIVQGTASVDGWFGWASDMDLDVVLAERGEFTYSLVFTPTNTDWYNAIENIEVTLQVVETIPTDMDSQTVDTQAVKVLRGGQLYILRAGKTYDSTGRVVR